MEGSAREAKDEFSREQSLIWRCWSVYRWLIPVACLPAMLGRDPVPSAPLRAHRESKVVTRRKESRSASEPSPFPPSPLLAVLAVPKSGRAGGSGTHPNQASAEAKAGVSFFALVISNDITSCIQKHSRVGGSETTAQVPPTQTRSPSE